MSWTGNSKIFKTYVPGDGKKPAPGITTKGKDHIATFDEAAKSDSFGAIMQDGYIDISFDDPEMSERFLEMAEANEWRCLVLENPDNKHIHTYWKNEQGGIKKLSSKDQKLAVGLIADIHGGATYIPLRVHGVDRFPPDYDILEGEDYQEVPEELLPVYTQINLWKQDQGGRNNGVSGMAVLLSHDKSKRFSKEQILRILNNTNNFVFLNPLSDSELKTILRDETFAGITETPKLNTLNGVELSQMDIKPVEFVIEGLIPVGLSLLASPPKYGKSWLCLDMSLSVAYGRDFLGFKTNKSGVLYLSLEDRFDRLKQRAAQILDGDPLPSGLELAIDSATLDNGFIEQLEEFLTAHPKTKLIIIDTFVKVRGEAKRNESAYGVDSREAGVIKKFADSHGVAVVLVTHTRKGIDPDDPFVNITGTYGVAGAADDMIVLTKQKRSDDITKMSVTGRDVSYEEFALTFDKDHGKWMRRSDSFNDFMARTEIEMKRAGYLIGNTRKTIFKLLEDNGGVWSGFCKAIIEKSKEYGTPIALTSQKLGKELAEINGFLFEDGVLHTEISKGTAASKHKFEKCDVST
ncbi:MAG: helicase RepA family protein [Oscillospiraceae bacterium]|nr:helicase RepA family protein [Oscillospiraceae bacterium]